MNSRSVFVFSICVFLVFSLHAVAQTDSVYLSIDELFSEGVSESLVVSADRVREGISSENVKTSRNMLYPEIEVGLNAGVLGQPVVFRNGLSSPSYPECPDWSQNYAVNFSQPLYAGGKIRSNIKKSEIDRNIAVLSTLSDIAELKLSLLEKYLTLLNLYRRYDVLSRSIEESERRLVDIRRMKREGVITNNDVLRSEMQLTDNRLLKSEAENDIELVSQQIALIIGRDENVMIVPDTVLPVIEDFAGSYEDYVTVASGMEPGLQIARFRTIAAGHELEIEKSACLPHLSLYAANTLARPVSRTLADMYNNNWNVGLSLSYSLSSLYQTRHKVNSARMNVLLNRNAEEQRMQEIRMEIRNAYLKHKEAVERVHALELSVRQAHENYRIMHNRYMNQLAILTDLLDADNIRLNAELQLTNAKTNVVYTYYQLRKACGNL